MKLYADLLDFPANCGFEILGNFSIEHRPGWGYRNIKPEHIMSGTGILVATFNESESSKAGYEWIKDHFKILWQSEVYPNLIHDDESNIFMVVFEANRGDKYEDGNW